MARRDRQEQRKKDQLDAYKKEIGKQYMDGLISDKEYERLLHEKEAELGLDAAPATGGAEKGKECPSCGALVGNRDTACNICGGALQPSLDDSLVEGPETPAGQDIAPKERECPTCGAAASDADTICSVCGEALPSLDTELEGPIPEAPAATATIVCASCGAEIETGSTECPICETPLDIVEPAAQPVPAAESEPEPVPEPVPVPAEPVPEILCAECGASLDEGTDECFICGAKVGAAPAEPEPVPKPASPPEPAPAAAAPKEPAAELVCAGCGASVDEGTDECFICGAKIGEAPAEPVEPMPIPADDDIERPPEPAAIEAQPAPEPVPEEPAKPEVVLGEGEIQCPSCSSVIKGDNDKCPECWTDLSLYVMCTSCGRLTPAGETNCRECYAAIEVAAPADEPAAEPVVDDLFDEIGPGLEIPDEVEISQELKDEMAGLEAQEEQGKECLVCGAIFGPQDEFCPICGMELGVEIEEPERPQLTWEGMEVEVQPLVHTCPNCGNNVTGLEATDREVSESRWFYRGLVAIFTGIFFTSFSIYARGISVENASLGMHPPPTDWVLTIFGWLLVAVGFVFWYLSWRLHEQRTECPACGVETEPGMTVCVNCGGALGDDLETYEEPPLEDAYPEEQVLEEELPQEQDVPAETFTDEELELPPEEPPAQPVAPQPIVQPKAPAPAVQRPVEEPPKEHFVGEELPVEHEEHKKCPGCGIFVDLNETMCPICDTVFDGPEPAPEVEVPTEADELEAMKPAEDLSVPKPAGSVECPSCGAELEAGTKACPVCEYPIG